jgi:hypothetical protein
LGAVRRHELVPLVESAPLPCRQSLSIQQLDSTSLDIPALSEGDKGKLVCVWHCCVLAAGPTPERQRTESAPVVHTRAVTAGKFLGTPDTDCINSVP